MFGRERRRLPARFLVHQQVGAPLDIAGDAARRVGGGGDKAQRLELPPQRGGIGGGEFAEFEPVQAHRIDVHMLHRAYPGRWFQTIWYLMIPYGERQWGTRPPRATFAAVHHETTERR